MQRISGYIITILIFAILNVALYYGQEWYHSADVAKSLLLEKEIDAQKYRFTWLEIQLMNIQEKAKEITSEGEWDQLNDKYIQFKQEYDTIFKAHNKNIEEYNKLIRSCGARWYIIPIPRCGKSSCKK